MTRLLCLTIASVLAINAAPASAQEVASAPVCELHIYPTFWSTATKLTLMSTLGGVGSYADAQQNRRTAQTNAILLSSLLNPTAQLEAFGSFDIAGELGIPGAKIFYEPAVGNNKKILKSSARLSRSVAPCYAELIVSQNFFKSAPIYGRSLNNRFVFKDFRQGQTKARVVEGRGGSSLSKFPPMDEAERGPASADLRRAFVANFHEFNRNRVQQK